ncbi:class I SAM-dependent methyltransferase [Calidifontibacter sp. DB0510]|uniref:Class I SAM-dependent methyltransferase n=1 Tax=Metallococcus carri TaxID=1656884 RepID=A0A967E9R9_9MICO|nr:class I SAM-dependent methyltransferase [Metallococcus carri]NHN55515.1 class I SAM-dependent methyltransferase [Metallococcus carri]NOP38301.1 class I SAM-dependent methyltransferase [Calidifontibacter sp. DB2511S]
MGRERPVGTVTRGTTNPNRLRRCDRWLLATQAWRLRERPVIVDLGYGASPVTALELHDRVCRVRPQVEVIGIEIDPGRVAAAAPLARPGLSFALGGFEIPVPGQVDVVRAFNVLRQYDESQVGGAWDLVRSRLTPAGLFIDGTCDEIGRLATWVAVTADGPQTLTLSMRLGGLEDPSVIAERLPKALIHRNVPGEAVHDLLDAMASAWRRASPHSAYGRRQQWLQMVRSLRADWPVRGDEKRWRLGELTLDWSAIAPTRNVSKNSRNVT